MDDTAPNPTSVNENRTEKTESLENKVTPSPTTDIPNTPVKIKPKFFTKKKIIALIIFVVILVILLLVYIIYMSSRSTPTDSDKDNLLNHNQTSQNGSPFDINYEFASYNLDTTSFKPALPNYTVILSEIANLEDFETSSKVAFSTDQKDALTSNNFFIIENNDHFYGDDPNLDTGRIDDWTDLYSTIGGGGITQRKPENSVFVSSDLLLHIYHKLLEKEFEYIETTKFYPSLKEITDKVLSQAIADYPQQSDNQAKQSYERIIAFFAVPKAILDSAYEETKTNTFEDQKLDSKDTILKNLDDMKSTIPDYSYQKAKAELDLVLEQNNITQSPLFDKFLSDAGLQNPQDYTQFTPRSHYTRNSILRTYFRAMMWYGRNNFVLSSSELTRDALNISSLMNKTNELKNWESIYIPTAFLVGKSDDLGVYEYLGDMQKIGSDNVTANVISQVQEDMKSYQGPQIQSSVFIGSGVFDVTKEELIEKTKGFRFMGQRFTPDAYIFTSLTQGDEKPDPETGQKLPSSTTALMVMSTLGNKTADPLVTDWVDKNAPNSDKVIAKNINALKDSFAKVDENTWTQNIYWGWLYTMKSLYTADLDKAGYPAFMKNTEWDYKDLSTSLGTWTELKHDTLLYAKQSYAEMGGGPNEETPPPVPKGYVEPNITFFDRLIALVQMTNDGLNNRDLLDGLFEGRNNNFLDSLRFFKDLAVKELQNEQISDEEFERLRNEPGNLEFIVSPLGGEMNREKDARSALVADVHTDVPKGEILYEADGIPNYIYVAVKDKNGTRLTKGLVYNYYEFTKPITTRMTDEDWQVLNYSTDKSSLPPIPDWSQILYK
jgi:hypothetical protein